MKKLIAFLLFPMSVYAGPATMFGLPYDGTNNEYPAKVNSSGQLSISLLAGEDQTNDVLKVEHQYSYCAGIVADGECGSGANFVHTVTCAQDDAAPTAGSLAIRDSTAAASGTIIQNITFTTAAFLPFTIILDANLTTGLYLDFTTTADVECSASYR